MLYFKRIIRIILFLYFPKVMTEIKEQISKDENIIIEEESIQNLEEEK